MKVLGQIVLVLVVLYVTSYIVLRSKWAHRREKDNSIYMEFPVSPAWVYYFYRPLCIGDAKLSGMHFHIGPHPGSEADAQTTAPPTAAPTAAPAPAPVQ